MRNVLTKISFYKVVKYSVFRVASFYFFSGWVKSIVAAAHIETIQKYFHLFFRFYKIHDHH